MKQIYTYSQMISELGEIPICGCKECQKIGRKVEIHPNKKGSYSYYKNNGYPKFISGHNMRGTTLSEKHKKNIKIANSGENNYMYDPNLHKTREEIIVELGEPPVCLCDECQKNGTKVPIRIDVNSYRKYRKEGYDQFISGHQTRGINNKNFKPEIHISYEEMIYRIGEIPFCKCECGNKVNIDYENFIKYVREGYPQYIDGHLFKTQKIKDMVSKRNTEMWKDPEYRTIMTEIYSKRTKELWKNEEYRNKYMGKNNSQYGKTSHSQRIFPHQTPLQGLILFHRWDRKYAQYLDFICELYLYEPKYFELTLEGKDKSYIPDFYLPLTNEYIEVKGYFRGDAKEKYDLFLKIYPEIKIKLLMKDDLLKLDINLNFTKEERELLDNYKEQQKLKK